MYLSDVARKAPSSMIPLEHSKPLQGLEGVDGDRAQEAHRAARIAAAGGRQAVVRSRRPGLLRRRARLRLAALRHVRPGDGRQRIAADERAGLHRRAAQARGHRRGRHLRDARPGREGQGSDHRLHRPLQRQDAVVSRRPRHLQTQHRRRHVQPDASTAATTSAAADSNRASESREAGEALGTGDGERGVRFCRSTPQSAPEACPRGVFLAPAFGAGSLSATHHGDRHPRRTTRFNSALLDGQRHRHERAADRPRVLDLRAADVGENVLSIALPASALKPLGCADLTLDDATPVTISTTHKVFHDARADEVERYRKKVGLRPVGARHRARGRAAARRRRLPRAGHGLRSAHGWRRRLPGQSAEGHAGWRDRFRRRDRRTVVHAHRCNRRAAAQRAASRSARGAGVAAAAGGGDSGSAAAGRDLGRIALLAKILELEGTARRLVVALESSSGIPDPADIDALEALGTQLAATTSNGEIVVKGREYPELSITVKVQ